MKYNLRSLTPKKDELTEKLLHHLFIFVYVIIQINDDHATRFLQHNKTNDALVYVASMKAKHNARSTRAHRWQ